MNRWPGDYSAARSAFRAEASRVGARLEAVPIAAPGPGGEALSIDVARLGSPGARRVLAVTSATHGNEGAAGTAAQLGLLADLPGLLAPYGGELPADTAILLVHAVNPWGYAWHRRQNEDNVDLNRNFVDWSEPRPQRPVYVELHPLLCPERLDEESEAAFRDKAYALIAEHGIAWLQARLTEGQYQVADGLYFGGHGPAESNARLHGIFAEHLANARECVLVDVHTGMGAWGDWLVIAGAAAGTTEGDWLLHAYAPQRVHLLASGGEAAGGRWPTTSGKMTTAMAAANPHCALRGFSCEFGTVEGERAFMAERREHWLYRRGDRGSATGQALVAELDTCMNPADSGWRQLVERGAAACLADGWRALNAPFEQ